MTQPSRRQVPIRIVLMGGFVLVAAVAILALSAERYRFLTGEQLREELEQELALARSVALGLDRYITGRRQLIDSLAAELSVLGLSDLKTLTALLETANGRDPAFRTLFLTDRAGVAIAFSPPADADGRPNVGRRYDDRSWFKEMVRPGRQTSYDVVIGRAQQRPTVAVAAPIHSANGELLGVVAGGLNLDELRRSLHGADPAARGRLVVVDGRGRALVHGSSEWETEARDLSHEDVYRAAQRLGEGTVEYLSTFTGVKRWAAYVRLPSTGWSVWASRGPEARDAKIRSLLRGLIVSGMAGAAAAMVAAFLLSRVISRPLTALAEGTRRLSGEGSRHLELPRADSSVREFAELQAGFRQMAETLRAQYEGLEAKVAERTRDLEQALREARAAAARLQAQEEIRRGYGELAALLNSLDRSHVLQEGTRKIAASLRAPLAAVYLSEDGSDRLLLKTYAALDPAPLEAPTLSPAGVPAEVARRREPLVVSPPHGTDRLTLSTGVGAIELAAVAALPLQYQDRLLGVLAVALLEPPTEDTRSFLESAARQLSVALNNAALFESSRYQSQRVEQLNVALRQASEAKSQFLSSMSHELRTPLNAIIGFTDLLLMGGRDPLTARQQTALEKVRESGQHLLGLINQVLDLSKIEAGRMEVRAEAFPLAPLVQECLATVEPQATAKGLHLAAVGLEAPLELVQDRAKVKQILLNLLANAVKFTTEGSVEVRVASAQADAVAVTVVDTGPGIPAEEQEAVFDEFRQLAAGRDAGGTGLGLPIGRRLAALLGGTLTLESTPGRGSVFTLRLPRRLGRPASTAVGPHDEGDDRTDLPRDAPGILLIDDDRNVFDIVRGALTGEPIRVEWTPRADDGLARARAGRPRLVLLDVMLQGQDDGWETLRALKSDPVTREIPVVLHSVIDNPERARQLGAVAVLPKPVTAIAIKSLVQSLINGPPLTRGDQRDES